MATVTESGDIAGVFIVQPDVHSDHRGTFVETFRRSFIPNGREMLQSNRGDRVANTVVGLHYHLHQSDYWYIPYGRVRVVLHDLREGSPTDGATQTLDLGGERTAEGIASPDHDHRGVYIPPGVAHGFGALTGATVAYLVDGYYNPADELGVAWDDPAIGADWGVSDPVLSERDRTNPLRNDLPVGRRPYFGLRT